MSILNSTEVRANFGSFIDNVVHDKPQVIKRNRDLIAALSIQHTLDLLASHDITIEYSIENEHFNGSIVQIPDIVGEGISLDELIKDLADQLYDYAKEYYDNFNMYYHSPNRREHFPYILRVLLQDDRKGVVQLLRG
ncbi:hypothetical protein KIK04_15530 [Paenibacillus sp. 481]|nr:hypothetical protein KIK04_15530 [Paenibacillus sp. 481]